MKRKFYARVCDYTNRGMNTGYVFVDDSTMIDDDTLFHKEIRKDRQAILEQLPDDIEEIRQYDDATNYTEEEFTALFKAIKDAKQNKETNEQLSEISYVVGYHYYTDWECVSDIQWEEVDGKLISIEEHSEEEYDKIINGEYEEDFDATPPTSEASLGTHYQEYLSKLTTN